MPAPTPPGLLLEARYDAGKVGRLVSDLGHIGSHKLPQRCYSVRLPQRGEALQHAIIELAGPARPARVALGQEALHPALHGDWAASDICCGARCGCQLKPRRRCCCCGGGRSQLRRGGSVRSGGLRRGFLLYGQAGARDGSSGSSGSNGSNGSSGGGSSGGGRQGSGRRSSGNDDFKDRRPADRWDGPLDPEWELRLRAARSPDKMRGVVRDPWQDKLLKRVFLPKTPQQAMLQAVDAVDHALDQGVFRLRVQMNLAEFDLHRQSLSQSSWPVLVNKLASMLLARGLRVCLLFNTLRDASDAKINLHPDLIGKVAISVLGLGDFGEMYDVAVLVCASNEGDENLQRIEEVERLIYAGPPKDMTKKVDKTRYMQRPIILMNPALEAIHSMASASRKVKPMFMSDFQVVYFLQTHSASSSALDAALFKSIRQVPETWQVWVREYTGGRGQWRDMTAADSTSCSVETRWGGHSAIFTLIWEKKTFPSDMDLAYMTDISNLEWLASASRSL
eukprot:Tamp_12584.p1 GENE.Tamp_12584~~Tamp_12584.p1  ORF type:complete len:575 (+),score=83.99 Tamp_12584:205-1725(+)